MRGSSSDWSVSPSGKSTHHGQFRERVLVLVGSVVNSWESIRYPVFRLFNKQSGRRSIDDKLVRRASCLPVLPVNFAGDISASVGAFRTVHMIKSFSVKYPSAFRDFLQNVGKIGFTELSKGILGSRLTTLRSERGHRSPLGAGSICPRPSEDPPNGSNHSLNVLPGKLSLSPSLRCERLPKETQIPMIMIMIMIW